MFFNKVQQAVAFFVLLPATWPWRWKSHGGDRERNVQRERERERRAVERERVSQIKLFGFRNKYEMY